MGRPVGYGMYKGVSVRMTADLPETVEGERQRDDSKCAGNFTSSEVIFQKRKQNKDILRDTKTERL